MRIAAKLLSLLEEHRLGKTVLQFSDELAWVYREQDGQGSKAGYVSLVVPEKEKQGEKLVSRLKIWLDTDHKITNVEGRLKKKYHKYLIQLLIHDFITGLSPLYTFDSFMKEFGEDTAQELLNRYPKFLEPQKPPPRG